jgi:hypothetical protein
VLVLIKSRVWDLTHGFILFVLHITLLFTNLHCLITILCPPILLYPKLRNTNLHNVTHSLISRNPREGMDVIQISLHIVTFLSLISQNLSSMQIIKEVNPHPCIAPCVNTWSFTFFFFFFFFFLYHMLNVGACDRHITREGQVEWTTLY